MHKYIKLKRLKWHYAMLEWSGGYLWVDSEIQSTENFILNWLCNWYSIWVQKNDLIFIWNYSFTREVRVLPWIRSTRSIEGPTILQPPWYLARSTWQPSFISSPHLRYHIQSCLFSLVYQNHMMIKVVFVFWLNRKNQIFWLFLFS